MTTSVSAKPSARPQNPQFSSGPCAKRPGWSVEVLKTRFWAARIARKEGKARLNDVIERTRRILSIPDDYRIAIVPASDTGAVEMALWSLLGARGVDLLAWESFARTGSPTS